MKYIRHLSILVAIVMLLSIHPVLADDTACDLFTFVELYMQRKNDFEREYKTSYGIIMDDYNRYRTKWFDTEHTLHATCIAGDINFRTDDFQVTEWSDILMILNDDKSINERSKHNVELQFNVLLAIAALEYSTMDELIMKINNDTPITKAFDILQKALDMVATDMFMRLLEHGRELTFYTGKYQYFLHYYKSDDIEMIPIIARIKE